MIPRFLWVRGEEGKVSRASILIPMIQTCKKAVEIVLVEEVMSYGLGPS
jgi:hypothetical protein